MAPKVSRISEITGHSKNVEIRKSGGYSVLVSMNSNRRQDGV